MIFKIYLLLDLLSNILKKIEFIIVNRVNLSTNSNYFTVMTKTFILFTFVILLAIGQVHTFISDYKSIQLSPTEPNKIYIGDQQLSVLDVRSESIIDCVLYDNDEIIYAKYDTIWCNTKNFPSNICFGNHNYTLSIHKPNSSFSYVVHYNYRTESCADTIHKSICIIFLIIIVTIFAIGAVVVNVLGYFTKKEKSSKLI